MYDICENSFSADEKHYKQMAFQLKQILKTVTSVKR